MFEIKNKEFSVNIGDKITSTESMVDKADKAEALANEWKEMMKQLKEDKNMDAISKINNLIKDIENDPYGRRKIVSLWQEADLHETPGLAPCAFLTIWNVRGDKLDMMLVQRSGDMLTASGAGGINEIQYAALLMMIARHTGYAPGVFTHVVANEQIYDRHIDAAHEMLARFQCELEPDYEKVTVILNPDKTNFYDMTIDDFIVMGYDPIKPQLKLELGI